MASTKKNKKKNSAASILIIVVGIFGITFLIVGIVVGIRASLDPVETVIAFSEEFNDGEYKKMLRYVDPSEAKIIRSAIDKLPPGLSRSALNVLLPFLSDTMDVKLYPEIISVQQEKKRAVVTVRFRNLDESHYYDVYLSRKNLVWYIRYIWISDEELE